jgi:hypothetical protein
VKQVNVAELDAMTIEQKAEIYKDCFIALGILFGLSEEITRQVLDGVLFEAILPEKGALDESSFIKICKLLLDERKRLQNEQ